MKAEGCWKFSASLEELADTVYVQTQKSERIGGKKQHKKLCNYGCTRMPLVVIRHPTHS